MPHGWTGQQRDRIQLRVLAVERMACLLGAVGPTCCTTKPVLVSASRTQTFRLPKLLRSRSASFAEASTAGSGDSTGY